MHISKTLDVISIILSQLQDELRRGEEDHIIGEALLECQNCVEEVSTSVKDLAPVFLTEGKAYKAWASLRAVNRTKLIAKLEDRLEKAKSTLSLALQSSAR